MKKTNETVIEETVVEATAVEQSETESKTNKVGGFIKRNAKKIAVGAVGVVVACAGFCVVKNRCGSSADEEVGEEVAEELSETFEETPEE